MVARGASRGLGHRVGPSALRAVVAAPARRSPGIVELTAQILHPACGRGDVAEHGLLFACSLGGNTGVAISVVLPRLSGCGPAAGDPADGAVYVKYLEHRLQP